jgi:peptidoglycan/xylan/chitin deacetylase (PgdA/CDA1 family)
MYHHISSAPAADELTAGLTVTDEDFARQLAYLKCAGYTSITVAQLFSAVDGLAGLPAKGVILTFDDGYDDAYTDAFPALRDAGLVGSFAIITGFVEGGGPYATWAQLKEMHVAGMEITSHTATHIDLGEADDFSLHQQLYDSKAALAQRLGQDTPFLVYPAGEPFRSGSAESQQRVVAALREAGYRGALLDGSGTIDQDPAAPYALNRVRVSGGEGLGTFAASIGGVDPVAAGC